MAKSMSDLLEIEGNNKDGKIGGGEGFKGGDHIWIGYSDEKFQPKVALDKNGNPYISIPVKLHADANGDPIKFNWSDTFKIYDIDGKGSKDFATWFKRSGLIYKYISTFGDNAVLDVYDDKTVAWIAMNSNEIMFRAITTTVPKRPYNDSRTGLPVDVTGKIEVKFQKILNMNDPIESRDAPAQSQDGIEL